LIIWVGPNSNLVRLMKSSASELGLRAVLMFLASISSSFLFFQFVRSGTVNVDDHAQVCGLFCVLFMILCGFVQAKALNLEVLPIL